MTPMQQRVTIRIPLDLARAMELRAQAARSTVNAEYMRAVREHLEVDGEVVTVECFGHEVHAWVTRDDIAAAQLSPGMIVMRPEAQGGFLLRGRVLTLDRQWFVSDQAFGLARNRLADSGAPLIAESEAWWESTPATYPIVTYGWPGPPPRLATVRELRLGRDAVLDYQIVLDIGEAGGGMRASVSPEAWFRILGTLAPWTPASWPDPANLHGTDLLAARAFRDVAIEAAEAGVKEFLVKSSETDLIRRICARAEQLRQGIVAPVH
jgi:hypothetical protein